MLPVCYASKSRTNKKRTGIQNVASDEIKNTNTSQTTSLKFELSDQDLQLVVFSEGEPEPIEASATTLVKETVVFGLKRLWAMKIELRTSKFSAAQKAHLQATPRLVFSRYPSVRGSSSIWFVFQDHF